MHRAATEGQVEALRAALSAGEDVNLPDKQGYTPLHFAAQQGQVQAARVLVDAGADVHVKDADGNTPLWKATFGNSAVPELVALLMSAGSDPDSQNNAGRSPRDIAETFAQPHIKLLLG